MKRSEWCWESQGRRHEFPDIRHDITPRITTWNLDRKPRMNNIALIEQRMESTQEALEYD